MTEKENIAKRFSNFEPEVDEKVIDQNWDKIKYFVPKKEEKKKVFFLPRFLVGCVSAMVIGLLSGFGIWYYFSSDNASHQAGASYNTNKGFSEKRNGPVAKQGISDTESGKEHTSGKTTGALLKTETKKNSSFKQPHHSSISVFHSFGNNTINNTQPARPSSAVNPENPSVTSDAPLVKDEPYYHLQPVLTGLPQDKSDPEILFIQESPVFAKLKKALLLDVFAGVQQEYTGLTSRAPAGFHLGIALTQQIKNRLGFQYQFLYSRTNLNFKEEIVQNILPPKPSTPPSVSSGTLPILYVQGVTANSIKSHIWCQGSWGLHYVLSDKQRIQAGAFALIDVRYDSYSYGYTKQRGTEVFSYTVGDPDSPYSNAAPADFKAETVTHSSGWFGVGATAGFSFGYKLNHKATLLLRPSYSLGFTERKITLENNVYSLKQRQFLLSAGIRFNL